MLGDAVGVGMEDLRNRLNLDLPRCRGSYLEVAPKEIWDNPNWFLEPKLDGNRCSLQLGEVKSLLVGRNRQDFLKGVKAAGKFRDQSDSNPIIAAIKAPDFSGTILDGELTECFNLDGTLDKDSLYRQKLGLFCGYTAWTVLVFNGVDVRDLNEHERFDLTRYIVNFLKNKRIQVIDRYPATSEVLKDLFSKGLEGVVAKQFDKPIPRDRRTNSFWVKIKGDKHRTVDAFIIGVTEAKSGGSGLTGVKPKLNGKAASFSVGMYSNGRVMEVGKMGNLPDNCQDEGLKHFHLYRNLVVEMRVSGWNGKAFRWPRWEKWRTDKTPLDCQFEEQIGRREKTRVAE